MNDHFALSSSVASDLALVLLHFLWQGTLIAAATWCLLRIGHKARPSVRYVILLLGGLLCTVAPVATLIHFQLQADVAVTALADDVAIPSAVIPPESNPQATPSITAPVTTPVWQLSLVAVWLFGVLLMAGRLVIGWLAVHRLRTQASPPTVAILELLMTCASRLSLARVPKIAVSSRIAEAMVVGLFRPMILLPASWLTELPPDVLTAVVAHELAHIRRFDPWVNAVQRFVEMLLFYHPAVWWLSHRLRMEREFCCDELAVRITGQPLVYARTLELVAHHRLRQPIPALATGIGDGKMTLLKRVQHVLGGREDRPRSLLTPLAAVCLVLLAFAIHRAAWFTPAPLMADDEPRRDREVERARRFQDEDREERRRERRTDVRSERNEDEEREREFDERNEDPLLDEELPPAVRELINDLRSEIDQLRAQLRDGGRGEIELDIEYRDVDRDGDPDVVLDRRRVRIRRGDDQEGEHREHERERELDEEERESVPDVRWRLELEEENQLRERQENDDLLTELPEARVGIRNRDGDIEIVELDRDGEVRELRDEHAEHRDERHERHAERREEHVERRYAAEDQFEGGEPPRDTTGRRWPTEQPEQQNRLEAEVRELREQVNDLAELIGDLRNELRDRDHREEVEQPLGTLRERQRRVREEAEEAERRREDAERDRDEAAGRDDVDEEARFESESGRRSTLRRGRERTAEELERRRDREDEDDAEEGELEGNESVRLETDDPRRVTVQSTDSGRVRLSVSDSGGSDAVLEAHVIELTDNSRIELEAASGDADPFGSDAEAADKATDPFVGDDAAGEADPFDGE